MGRVDTRHHAVVEYVRGGITVDKLKEVDRVSVVSANGSVYFNRVGGMWINHIKGETLDDEAMGKVIAAYEDFGWNTIYPAEIKSPKITMEEITRREKEAFGERETLHDHIKKSIPDEMIVPENAYRVVLRIGSQTFEYKSAYAIHPAEGMIYNKPYTGTITLKYLRKHLSEIIANNEKVTVTCYDVDNIIMTSVSRLG